MKGEKVRKWSNLEKDEWEGLVSSKKKAEAQENVVFQTDKSGRFSIDSLENYKTASQPHISDSVAITKGEHDRLQQLINAHSVSWIRILDAEGERNSEMRIKSNMLNSEAKSRHYTPCVKIIKSTMMSTVDPLLDLCAERW